jgi:hypothetical protein
MAQPINGLRYYEVTFDESGNVTADDGFAGAVRSGGIEELFVFSHGWNNSRESAQQLYQRMFGELAGMLGKHLPRSAAVGVFWPSLLFPGDDPAAAAPPASTSGDAPARKAPQITAQASGAELAAALAPAFPDKLDQLNEIGTLLDTQPQDPAALTRFHELAGGLVTTPNPGGPEDAGMEAVKTGNTAAVFGHAAAMSKMPANNAEGIFNPFSALWNGAREVLRTLSYYEMKNRAGVIGKQGLGPLLAGLSMPNGQRPREHLMGHSFGARLVASSLAGLPDSMTGTVSPVKSLMLVQGAFSHFAFADHLPMDPTTVGALATVKDRVDGPLLATHSLADRAVGWWYPTASMLSHSNSESATDLTYEWGGMGHDGYQQDGVTDFVLQPQGTPYSFETGSFYRLDSNGVIRAIQSPFSGAHSDIVHPEVAWAVVCGARLNAQA